MDKDREARNRAVLLGEVPPGTGDLPVGGANSSTTEPQDPELAAEEPKELVAEETDTD
jgi:hypothetical protein